MLWVSIPIIFYWNTEAHNRHSHIHIWIQSPDRFYGFKLAFQGRAEPCVNQDFKGKEPSSRVRVLIPLCFVPARRRVSARCTLFRRLSAKLCHLGFTGKHSAVIISNGFKSTVVFAGCQEAAQNDVSWPHAISIWSAKAAFLAQGSQSWKARKGSKQSCSETVVVTWPASRHGAMAGAGKTESFTARWLCLS